MNAFLSALNSQLKSATGITYLSDTELKDEDLYDTQYATGNRAASESNAKSVQGTGRSDSGSHQAGN